MSGQHNEAEDAEREATSAELLNQCFEIWKDTEGITHYSYYVGQGDDIRTINVDEAWALAMGNDLYDFLAADRHAQKQKWVAEQLAKVPEDIPYLQDSEGNYLDDREPRAKIRAIANDVYAAWRAALRGESK